VIVVKCELWPMGDESNARELTRAYISNDNKTSAQTQGTHGSYDARFMQSVHFNPKKVWKAGRAENIHRTKCGVWDILYVCLRSAGLDKRNPVAEKKGGEG
jgi:hypothetical protein